MSNIQLLIVLYTILCHILAMDTPMNKAQIVKLLQKLGAIYEQLNGPPVTLGVCGGAALIFLNLTDRITTKDIDLIFPTPWPAKLSEAVKIVSDNYGLPKRWMNAGPELLTEMGLPAGFHDRAFPEQFGKKLTLLFASRYDQIFFKVYAAADRDPSSYHVSDLLNLKPSSVEMLEAARWCQTHDTSDSFKHVLISMFQKLGYNDAANKI